jgi:hypothetical protein
MELSPEVDGCELRFLSNGQLFASQFRDSSALAIRWAYVLCDDLIADGWIEACEPSQPRPTAKPTPGATSLNDEHGD